MAQPIRKVDRTAWCDTRCVLTQADLQDRPKGSDTAQMFQWARTASQSVNAFLRGLQRL